MKKFLKFVLIVIIILLVLILAAGVGSYFFLRNKLAQIQYEELDRQQLGINEELYNEISEDMTIEEFSEIKTVVLYGSDSRNIEDIYNDGRSDCIIIASINPTDHTLKFISIPRDTYVTVPGYGKTKINHAFAWGGEQLSMKTINQNFGLNVSEYITIGWEGVKSIIDDIGGIDLEISESELNYINKNVGYTAKNCNGDPTKVPNAGLVHLNGTQVMTHCRNRYVGSDFVRAERQRTVIQKVLEKVMQMEASEINTLVDKFLGYIKTNINIKDYTKFIPSILKYKDEYLEGVTSAQVPSTTYGRGQMIDKIYYFVGDLETCKADFKKYLFGSEKKENVPEAEELPTENTNTTN